MGKLSVVSYTIKDISGNPAIFDKYSDPHGYIKGANDRWARILKANPYARDEDIALILTIDDGVVVGRLGLYGAPVVYNQKEERTFWLSGFFLKESYKNSGAGGLMLLRALSFSKCLMASGGPREDTEQLYEASGFHKLAHLKRFVYFYRSKVIIEKYIKNSSLSSLLSAIGSPVLKLYYKIKVRRDAPVLDYRPAKRLGGEIDRLLAGQTMNRFPKSSDTLNWILQDKEGVCAFQIFHNQKLIGYCLLRQREAKGRRPPHYVPDMSVGSLLDYYMTEQSEDTKRDLILFSIQFFKGRGVDVFECQTIDEDMACICRRYGMIRLGGNRVFFRPSPQIAFNPKSPWFLTHGTSDVVLAG